MSIAKIIFSFFLASVLGVAFAFGALFFLAHNRCVDFSVLENYNPGSPSIVLDDEGNEWARFQLDRREPIPLSQMPQHLIQAFVAAEDWNFFKHSGISWKGIVRSTLVNLYHGRIIQGASTITQQLVKLLFFDLQRTFKRKIKEQIWALLIEQQFTKEQILQTYLNHVYFGCGIYGVEAASQRFWGKHASQVTVDEAAVLAAIVRSPASYCPILCPLSSQKRRNLILGQMKKLNFIDLDQFDQAKEQPVVIREFEPNMLAPHLKEDLRQFLESMVGKQRLYCGGLTIQTTLNQKVQQQAEKNFYAQIKKLKESLLPDIDGGLVSVDVKTGEIKALVGGYDFTVSKVNRVRSRRQIGSVLKPLIFACALEQGMSFADTEIDEPFEMEDNGRIWAPGNYNKQFNGQMTLASALSRSNNIIAIKTLLEVGVEKVIDLSKRSGIQGPFFAYPSLALGCVDATLKETVGMFNIFANDGVWVEPHFLKWIKDAWGTKIWKKSVETSRVIDSRISCQVKKVLTLGLKRVRNMFFSRERWFDSEVISKTGTTNDSRTCWFAGSTPELTTAIYVGCDDNRSMGKNVYPLRTAFPIWRTMHADLPCAQKKFIYDPSLQEMIINEKTGEQVNPGSPGAIGILI